MGENASIKKKQKNDNNNFDWNNILSARDKSNRIHKKNTFDDSKANHQNMPRKNVSRAKMKRGIVLPLNGKWFWAVSHFFFLLLWSPFCLFISGHSFVSRFCSVYVIGARSAQRCAEWTPLDSFFSLSKCALCASVAEFGFQNVYAYVSSMVSEWLWLLFFFFF